MYHDGYEEAVSDVDPDQPSPVDSPAEMSTRHSTSASSPAAGCQTPIEPESPSHLSGHNDDTSHTASQDVYKYEIENGRTYHGYRAGTYHFPNDHTERDRLDFQFNILKYAFQDRNYFAALNNPRRILDIGTGTGQWAIEMGEEFPDAEVQGTDLSAIQPDFVPENVTFFVDDASEEDWAIPPASFDYIHTRVLLGCFTDFRDIVRRAFCYTKPGGYFESQEIMSTPYCDDGTMPDDWSFLEWTRFGDAAAMEADRPLRIANKLKRWYEQAGFVDVQERVFKMPMNPWAKDKHLKYLGRLSEHNWLAGLSGFSMGHFTRVLQWTKLETEVYLVNIRKAISDRNVHAYHKIFVVTGRKPLPDEVVETPLDGPYSSYWEEHRARSKSNAAPQPIPRSESSEARPTEPVSAHGVIHSISKAKTPPASPPPKTPSLTPPVATLCMIETETAPPEMIFEAEGTLKAPQ